MSEVSKVPNTVLLIKDQRAHRRCRRCETLYCNTNKGWKGYVCQRCRKWCLCLLHNTAYRVLLLMSEVSKVIVLCHSCQRCQRLLYSVYRAPCPSMYLSLPPGGFSGSPPVSPRRQLCYLSWTWQLQGWLQARCIANPQFLKLKGAQQPSNSYISMGTKLRPPYPNQDCLPV